MRSRIGQTRQGGMTLIEIMMVIAIMSAIAVVGLPAYSKYRESIMIDVCKKDLVLVSQRLEKYQSFNYRYPEYLADVGFTNKDPWGNDYQYLNLDDVDPSSGKIKEGDKGPKPQARKKKNLKPLNTDYDLFCMGKDGAYMPNVSAKESLDDVIRADDGAYLGYAEDY